MTDIVDRLWQSVTQGNAPSKDLAVEAADEIERLRIDADSCNSAMFLAVEMERVRCAKEAADEIERLRKQTLLAPSISWNGFLVSGMQESIDEVCRLIALEAHK